MGTPKIYKEIMYIAGNEAAEKLAAHFGGQRVYFPRWRLRLDARDAAIRRAHRNGLAPVDLAHRYGLSVRRIQQILAEGKADGEANREHDE